MLCTVYGMLMKPVQPKQQQKSVNDYTNKHQYHSKGRRNQFKQQTTNKIIKQNISQNIKNATKNEENEDNKNMEKKYTQLVIIDCHCKEKIKVVVVTENAFNDGQQRTDNNKADNNKTSSSTAIIDLTVLQIPAMALLSVANIFGMIGYYIPYVYIVGYAEANIQLNQHHFRGTEAAMFLSAIGVSNVMGRIIFGIIADKFAGKRIWGSSVKITALLINNCCLLFSAITTIAIPFCPGYWSLMVDCVLFGFFICE